MNTITAGDQVNPIVAVLPWGGHVVAWSGSGGVSAQFYDASGAKSGPEVPLATGFSAGGIAALMDGTVVVSLTQTGSDPQTHYPTSAVYFARYDGHGAPLGAPVLVDGSGNYDAQVSAGAVFALPGGGFALVDTNTTRPVPLSWVTSSIRVFDASGAPVESIAAGEDFGTPVQAMKNGGYVVANDFQTGPGPTRIGWQTFDAQGNMVDGAQLQSVYGQAQYSTPSVVALGGGGAVAMWNAPTFSNGAWTAHWQAQLIDSSGHATGTPIDWSFSSNAAPHLEPLPQGGFLASWPVADSNQGPYEVYAQAFDDSAQPAGSVQHLATLSGRSTYDLPVYSITATPDGGFLLDWEAKSDGEDIFEQKFNVVR